MWSRSRNVGGGGSELEEREKQYVADLGSFAFLYIYLACRLLCTLQPMAFPFFLLFVPFCLFSPSVSDFVFFLAVRDQPGVPLSLPFPSNHGTVHSPTSFASFPHYSIPMVIEVS